MLAKIGTLCKEKEKGVPIMYLKPSKLSVWHVKNTNSMECCKILSSVFK